ncbi:hypothetical protein CW751_11635 [Brumimicrobium salinarum]|uniref:DUF2254 domain-containing protein n=1 Tax=Brumimicrobium salinarum TaxID=2058658 RepID=A0A2I0R0Q0_9FLAO|nr:DUF2254 domain-containing protein [Brumimicrobium salinarum]PKR80147.1 hypothetical protein CW751_11635 [Brumimicrobium salinarum]
MVRTFYKFIKLYYLKVTQSIAFYPVLISACFLLLAILSLKLENISFIKDIKEELPYFFIEDYETSRAILSTIIGGIISLTVFSFSMVMVVLNQASSSFSPRLLPSLISNKKHQLILGFYIGTLLYCIILITALGAYGINADSMGFSTMIAALISLVCIGLFVYFINSISVAIQIHNIVDKIYNATHHFFKKELKEQNEEKVITNTVNSAEWTTLTINKTGYFRQFDNSLLKEEIQKSDNHFIILPYVNQHIWKGEAVIKIKNFINEEELKNILFCFDIAQDRHEGEENETGMIKLMEIAVKAMSPGINDPGTAINAINKIGQLLNLYLEFPHEVSKQITKGGLTITDHKITAEEILKMIIQPIRLYSKHDSSVMHVLIKTLKFTLTNPSIDEQNKIAVKSELNALKFDINESISNPLDQKQLIDLIDK